MKIGYGIHYRQQNMDQDSPSGPRPNDSLTEPAGLQHITERNSAIAQGRQFLGSIAVVHSFG